MEAVSKICKMMEQFLATHQRMTFSHRKLCETVTKITITLYMYNKSFKLDSQKKVITLMRLTECNVEQKKKLRKSLEFII